MFGLQKQFIKNYIHLSVAQNLPGRLTLTLNNLSKLDETYKQFDKYIIKWINRLEGVESTVVDYEGNSLIIHYDVKSVTAQKIFKWVNIILDTAIDNMAFIKKYWETDIKYVEETLNNILEKNFKQ